jgi:glutaminyl-tRNA synthetase
MSTEREESKNFIEEIIEEDIKNGKHNGTVHTRFPPEPNGFLHIGHTKAICINFELAEKYGGKTNLRFDDTNPTTEETKYVEAIKKDIKWLGFSWHDTEYYASDYFDTLYEYALKLIKDGHAYVDESSAEEISEMKGVPTAPGKESPFRNRPVEESLSEFVKMKEGVYPDGAKVLRAKVDMTSGNMHMRDPVIYRIKHEKHHRTGDKWCIYPMYDFAHGQSDSIENITHSLCSLEFIHHRPLYNWFIDKLDIFPSRQIEFARMNVAYMITSKRRLLKLVESKLVSGWDDPRMPTLSGMRRRGYPAEALRVFCNKVGTAKRDNLIEVELLESCVRDTLNDIATRVMVIENPLKLTITNYPEDQSEKLKAENNPQDEQAGDRDLSLSKSIFIEREDFMVEAPKKYFRLTPDKKVRLKHGYIISYESHTTDDAGNITEVFCEYFSNTKSGEDESGIKSKGVLHWVDAATAVPITIRSYDRLFMHPTPTKVEGKDFIELINKDSLHVNENALGEASLAQSKEGVHYQFFRKGYYMKDRDSQDDKLIFNRTITLKDSWAKINKPKV